MGTRLTTGRVPLLACPAVPDCETRADKLPLAPTHLAFNLLLVFVATVAACRDPGPRTVPVSGTITYDGAPISNGDILFIPEDRSLGPDAGKVENGEFRARAKPGTCRIEITALNIGPNTPIVMGSPIAENYIPEKYNTASELTVTVSPNGKNEYEFALTTPTGP